MLLIASQASYADNPGALTEGVARAFIQEHDAMLIDRDVSGIQRILSHDFEFMAVKKDGSVVRMSRKQFINFLADLLGRGKYRRERSVEEFHPVSSTVVRYISSLSESIEVNGVMQDFISIENYQLEMGEAGPTITELTVFEK